MKITDFLSSIALAKFFIGEKIITKTYNLSKDDVVADFKNNLLSISEAKNLTHKKVEEILKNNTSINLFLVSEFGTSWYKFLFAQKRNESGELFDIEISDIETGCVIEFTKDLQINQRMQIFFLLIYWFGFLSLIIELITFFREYDLTNYNQFDYTDFEMSLSYLIIISIWGILVKAYIEIVVKKKILRFIDSFEYTLNLKGFEKYLN